MLIEEIIPFKSKKQLDDEDRDRKHKEKVAALKKVTKAQKKQFADMQHQDAVDKRRSAMHSVQL